jgi:Tol biopolymer transport system component
LPFGESAEWLSIARKGGRLAYELWQQDRNLRRISGPNPPEASASPSATFAFSTRNERMPEYSPDGTKVAFVSDRSGNPEIWLCNSEGGECQKLTDLGVPFLGEWSPDGGLIAFSASESGGEDWDVFVISETGGLPRKLTNDDFQNGCPSRSKDGRWIYYHSNRDGWYQICRVSVENGSTKQLTRTTTDATGRLRLAPRVAQNGDVLFWRDYGIWSIPPEGGKETLMLEGVSYYFWWCTWKDNIVYIRRDEEGKHLIEMFDLVSRDKTELHSLEEGTDPDIGLTVSSDGRWIIYSEYEASVDLMLVEGFY